MAWVAQALWELAYHLYPREPLGQKRGLERIFAELQHQEIIQVRVEAVSLDSTVIPVHPDGTGAAKKMVPSPSANPEGDGALRFIWLQRMPVRR